ncbi:hypothetical protein [Flavobacterium columnare]|uniref:hypothetical protein n=1 Tax=Flavobacterium columnare TaxID=996 RepID=UPI000D19BC23|nr:hypothetical protein [Flavobacterium columnare]PTD14382.1 hypothetical protein C6N29_07995 [Flavobacterium columnare]
MKRYIDDISSSVDAFEKKFNEFSDSNSTKNNEDKKSNGEVIDSQELNNEIFIQDIDNSAIDTIRLLCYSLLSGEYVCIDDLASQLNTIEEKVKGFVKNADFLSNNVQEKIFEYSSAITMIIEGYKIFTLDISNKYSTERIDFLFSENNIFEKVLKESQLSEKLDVLTDYFFCILGINHIDHFPSNENDYITNLFELEKRLTNLKAPEYTDLTKDVLVKIKFLQHKWKQRKVRENPNSHLYLSDGNIKAVEDFKEENDKLKEWCDIIETQYELISSWIYTLESRVKTYKKSELSTLTVLQLHQLIKYYKDVKHDHRKLDEISKFLESKKSLTSSYNQYANIIGINYSLNNSFSLYLENNKNIDLIKGEYRNVKNKIKGEINNFFLEYKYLNRITESLVIKINEEDKIQYIEKYEDVIKIHCKETFESYFLKKEWSKLNFNYVFILPFEESLVPSTIKGLTHIFYASSFVLPPSNNQIEKDFLKIKEEYDKLILFVDTGKYFKKEIQKIEELNKELDKKDFKSIEIISIFTAIITFVLSSIPTYKFVDSVYEALLFMLSLATALAIFITLVLFSTRDLYKEWRAYIPVTVMVLVCLFGFNVLTNFEKKEIKLDRVTNKKLDSISNIKIDSILVSRGLKNSKTK